MAYAEQACYQKCESRSSYRRFRLWLRIIVEIVCSKIAKLGHKLHFLLTDKEVPKTERIKPDGMWSLLIVPVRMEEVADVFRCHLVQCEAIRNVPWVEGLLLSGGSNVQIHFSWTNEAMPYSYCYRLQSIVYEMWLEWMNCTVAIVLSQQSQTGR